MPWGLRDWLKGDVGDVRRAVSFDRIAGGKVVVFGGQRVLSLSRTRAWIVGMRVGGVGFPDGGFEGSLFECSHVLTRCGPRSSGRCVNVGIVRCGRNWVGCLRRV